MPSPMQRRLTVRGAGWLVVLALLIAAPDVSRGDPSDSAAASLPELAGQLGVRLDEVAGSFGFEASASPSFPDARFNKLLSTARRSLAQAIGHVEHDEICEGVFKLARTVSQLEHAADYGAAQGMSGWGFAEELASEVSFVAGTFLEDAIASSEAVGADPSAVALARDAELTGDALRRDGEWTAAMVEFVAGTCGLF